MQITGGYLKSRKIISPKSENVRPTLSKTRESVFNILMNLKDFEESSFLDVFAGSGIMGIEAVSRGFRETAFVERDKKTFYLLKENLKLLNIESKLYHGDALRLLKKIPSSYDVIYIDPPYQSGLYNKLLIIIKESSVLSAAGIVVLEHLEDEVLQTEGFEIIKQKKYSDKMISFIRPVL